MTSESFPLSEEQQQLLLNPRSSSRRSPAFERPDESDSDAITLWNATKVPSNRRKVAEHLANWFGAVCCLCGGEVDFAHRGRHPGAPNVDHIVPKDPLHGSGLDYWGNVQLVHEHCNLQKNSLALPQPEAWLYAELLAEAINKFDYSDSYEPSPLAELRDAATKLVAMSRMEARYFEMALESSRPDDLQERAVKHLAKFERRAAEAIQAVVEAQETRRSSRG